jgi:FkbM family methyltransferase
MTTLADETRAAALNIDHDWDRRALEWPLTRDSVVVEVGGYKGRWALQIAERYAPRLFVFEPQEWAAHVCQEVLGEQATVLPFALGDRYGTFLMSEWETDGCTFVKSSGHPADMCEISKVFQHYELTHIDLMLMNIEGYEYTLIPHMLDRGILPARLMVQFHTFADPTGERERMIKEQLAQQGYRETWTYGAVLTAWERRCYKNSGS